MRLKLPGFFACVVRQGVLQVPGSQDLSPRDHHLKRCQSWLRLLEYECVLVVHIYRIQNTFTLSEDRLSGINLGEMANIYLEGKSLLR